MGDFKVPKNINDFYKLFKNHEVPYPSSEELADLYISTGSMKLDRLLNGGLRRSTISEWYGANGSGKSTVGFSTAAQVLQQGGSVLWLDQEHALKPPKRSGKPPQEERENAPLAEGAEDGYLGRPLTDNRTRSWLETNGVDPYHPNLQIYQPVLGEDTYHMVDVAVAGSLFDLIVIDSIAALNTRAELEGDIGDSHYGQVAKLNSSALKRIIARYGVSKNTKTHIFIVNQVRDKIGSLHGGVKSTGGNALSHYVSYRIKMWRSSSPSQKSDGEVVQRVMAQIDKSRFGPAGRTEITISSKRGIDTAAELMEFGQEVGYVHRAGAWYYLYDRPVDWNALKKEGTEKDEGKGFVGNYQGETAIKDWIDLHKEWRVQVKSTM